VSRFDSAMRRRCFYDMIEQYEQVVPLRPTMAATAKALTDHLLRQWGVAALEEERAFKGKKKASREQEDTDNQADEHARASEAAKPKAGRKAAQQNKVYKSAEKVEESESEEDSDGVEPQKSPPPARKRKFSSNKGRSAEPVEDIDSSSAGEDIEEVIEQP